MRGIVVLLLLAVLVALAACGWQYESCPRYSTTLPLDCSACHSG